MFIIYPGLLTVLLVVLCVIGILAVTFRSCFPACCCKKNTDDQTGNTDQPSGRRNLAFDHQEEIRSIRPRPFNNMEQLESPPSYDEAIRQELFRFQLPATPMHGSEAENNNNLEVNNPSTNSTSNSTFPPTNSPQNSPTMSPRSRNSRSRSSSSISSSSGSSSPLSTINEEEEWPVRVVIDCIGVQAARLMDNCDTSVQLSNGNALSTNSKC
ncbi:uncharacterized protein [Parasteatoda tepidariorum]|uniref:uncharacterized protein isoform X2 n=1 Tax=Parasteatoda tepidariorum TaxID=114398 RepID=UPI001C7219A4|nr:uncharacterized protein LOC107452083 isoform X2 [Parasteatoda tepidariorum]